MSFNFGVGDPMFSYWPQSHDRTAYLCLDRNRSSVGGKGFYRGGMRLPNPYEPSLQEIKVAIVRNVEIVRVCACDVTESQNECCVCVLVPGDMY